MYQRALLASLAGILGTRILKAIMAILSNRRKGNGIDRQATQPTVANPPVDPPLSHHIPPPPPPPVHLR
jgi:hypothetical protein